MTGVRVMASGVGLPRPSRVSVPPRLGVDINAAGLLETAAGYEGLETTTLDVTDGAAVQSVVAISARLISLCIAPAVSVARQESPRKR